MPRLACWSCGRVVYTVAPIDALFAEERRCARCGALMNTERRELERRSVIRRQNPVHDPGPPGGRERRVEDRRRGQRRGGRGGIGRSPSGPGGPGDPGWTD